MQKVFVLDLWSAPLKDEWGERSKINLFQDDFMSNMFRAEHRTACIEQHSCVNWCRFPSLLSLAVGCNEAWKSLESRSNLLQLMEVFNSRFPDFRSEIEFCENTDGSVSATFTMCLYAVLGLLLCTERDGQRSPLALWKLSCCSTPIDLLSAKQGSQAFGIPGTERL